MKRITRAELDSILTSHHNNGDYKKAVTGVMVFKQENFDRPFTETERSYRVHSNSHHFGDYISNELTGNCLDGKDLGVRLDYYNWSTEYCYIDMVYERKMVDSDEWERIPYDEALKTVLGTFRDNDMTRDMLTIPNMIQCQYSTIQVKEPVKGNFKVLMAGLVNQVPMDTEYDEDGNRI